jgi:hypothetical protein
MKVPRLVSQSAILLATMRRLNDAILISLGILVV